MSASKLDTLLGQWPTSIDVDEARVARILRAALAPASATAEPTDDALLAAPLSRLSDEPAASATMQSSTQATGVVTGRSPEASGLEKNMGNSSDRNRDRTSFADLAKLANSPSMTPPPAAVVVKTPEDKKDDSGIVDFKALAEADPAGEERAKTTALASAGLFDDAPAPASSAPVSAAAVSAPPPVSAPASAAAPAPASVPAVASIAAAPAPVAATQAAEEKKKGPPIGIIIGGLAVAAAVAVGLFVAKGSGKSETASAPAPAASAEAKPVAAAASTPAPAADPTPPPAAADSVAAAPTASAPTDPAGPVGKAMPKITSTGGGGAVAAADKPAAAAPAGSVDPKLVFNMPQTAGGKSGDLAEEMRRRVGASGNEGMTAAAAGPAGGGNVPPKPSQGQLHGALQLVTPAAKKCISSEDPVAKVSVVFKSDGTVQAVNYSGAGASCIKAALSKAKVPPFSDPTYTVPVTVRGED